MLGYVDYCLDVWKEFQQCLYQLKDHESKCVECQEDYFKEN